MKRRDTVFVRLALGTARRMQHATPILSLALVLLGGCASFDGRGLTPGKATAAEVEALMGAPTARLSLPSGENALYFSRLPVGRAVFVATIGADGVLKSLEQRLTRENIAKLSVGNSTMKEVRELFGPPGRIGRLDRLPREWWEYKYNDGVDNRILWVQFSDDAAVREVIDLLEHMSNGHREGIGK